MRSLVKEEIKKLLELGIIEKSNSNFVSPCFAVLKSNGSIRLVIDYRKLNSYTTKSAYPIPNMNDLLTTFNIVQYFSNLDLKNG